MISGLDKMKVFRKVFYITGVSFLAGAVILTVWCIFAPIDTLAEKYNEYLVWLADLELKIAAIENKHIVVLVLFMLFFVKCAVPLYPFSILFVASAMVFELPEAMIINCLGMILIMSIKYESGVLLGGGNLRRLIRTSRVAAELVETKGPEQTLVLFLMRLVPIIPINAASQLYGSLDYDYKKFLVVSIIGYMPQMLSFSIMGRNARNPFSLGFIIPIIVLLLVSGTALLVLGGTVGIIKKVKK